LFCSPTASLMSCVTFCSICFTCDLHIYLMTKNTQQFHNQPRTGMFIRGEFEPRRRPWHSKTWPPCFKYKPSPTMPSPEPLKGFKYNPWPSVSTLAIIEPFFKYNPFPMALFVAFCAKADPTPLNAPVANVVAKPARNPRKSLSVFIKVSNTTILCFYKALAAKPARNPRKPPSAFMLWTTCRLLIFIVMPFPFS